MSMLQEFKQFAMRGNVLDLAVGLVIGAAFGRIVASFVGDILTPVLGLFLGGVDFASLYVPLSGGPFASIAEARAANVPLLAYGSFLQAIFDFLIVAFAIFLLIKAVNRAQGPKPAAAPPAPTAEEKLLTEIRDLLRAR